MDRPPQTFARFMQEALYHPDHGYYRRARSPFGASGDFYTAVQLAPFHDVVRTYVAARAQPAEFELFEIVDLGAGTAGLASALAPWRYIPVDWKLAAFPEVIHGLVLANEFFDALPVHLLRKDQDGWCELAVEPCGDEYRFTSVPLTDRVLLTYAGEYGSVLPSGSVLEVNLEASLWMKRIASALASGYLIVIDYGYNAKELVRFPSGTLMSYRRHVACAELLSHPGTKDLTALVNFSALKREAQQLGLDLVREEPLSTWILGLFTPETLQQYWEQASPRWRLQWKQLVFGLGETFRVLEFRKHPHKEKAPDQLGGFKD